MQDKGQNTNQKKLAHLQQDDSFVLEKGIFSNIFDKDIRRVYLYKKTERLARALHLIAPAFADSEVLRRRADEVAVALIDNAVLPPQQSLPALSRTLLSLSSLVSLARTGGRLSPMNADLVSREAHALLEEVAGYEEPRLSLGEVPTMAELSKAAPRPERAGPPTDIKDTRVDKGRDKGHAAAPPSNTERRGAILSILREKGPSYIKDISGVVRDVSEKTIQRELQSLVAEGLVSKEGERRWTRYQASA